MYSEIICGTVETSVYDAEGGPVFFVFFK